MAIVKCFKSHLEIFTTGHKNYGLLIETGLGGKGGGRGLRAINLFSIQIFEACHFVCQSLLGTGEKGRKKFDKMNKKSKLLVNLLVVITA